MRSKFAKPPRFSMGVTVQPWDEDGFTEYRGFQIQKHFVKRKSSGNRYEYRIVGYPTVYTDWTLACEDIDYMIHRRGRNQESC